MPKDLFSEQSGNYALYRPHSPKELFEYIVSHVEERKCAWDCATGNGQVAVPLSTYFEKIIASDISEKQLAQAPKQENIQYISCSAEQTPFAADSFDLITVAQAYHWLNWEKFYAEATRVSKPNCVIAVWMYDLLQSDDLSINELIRWFYKEITGTYWDKERKHVEDHYAHVSFDFKPLPSKQFFIQKDLTLQSLLGYFSSWSATQNYIKANGRSPVELVEARLRKIWDDESEKQFTYPIYLRMGRVEKWSAA